MTTPVNVYCVPDMITVLAELVNPMTGGCAKVPMQTQAAVIASFVLLA